MVVLSLFDGISCGRVALQRAGIPVTAYYACEIDKHAIKVSSSNWPDIIQLGSVTELYDWVISVLPKIDLLIGGSPCQGFSYIGKLLNFNDPRSALFFEFVRIWKAVKRRNPGAHFLLENVKMRKEYQQVITDYMGCLPMEINSEFHTPQKRKRLYWSSFPISAIPNKPCKLADCVLPQYVTPDLYLNQVEYERAVKRHAGGVWRTGSKNGKVDFPTPLTRPSKCLVATVIRGDRSINHIQDVQGVRTLSPEEWELLQGLPIGYTRESPKHKRYHALGNGWQVDTIVHIFKNLI